MPYPPVTLLPPPSLETHSLARLAVVLVSPRNTLNIGAVARAMSNFGASDLRVANIFYKDFRSASSAVGPSAELLQSAQEFPTTGEAIFDAQLVVGTSGASERPFLQPVDRLEVGARRIRAALDRGERVALLFGSEKFGLSNDDMSHCHLLLRIPTREQHPSMNLGQAAALCLYELARMDETRTLAPSLSAPQRRYALPQDFPRDAGESNPVSSASLERLLQLTSETLTACEYPGIGSAARLRQLRALLRRWQLSERDAGLAMGFLRQMLWKLGVRVSPDVHD